MTRVPLMIEGTKVYCDIFRDRVLEKDILKMKTLTDKLTMDVIGGILMYTSQQSNLEAMLLTTYRNIHLNSPQLLNKLVNAVRSQVRWLTFGNKVNPWQRYHHMYNAYIMNSYISYELSYCFAIC